MIFVVGPTAVGKSAFAVGLAMEYEGKAEIVSADAMQVYRELNLGTAKPSPDERKGVIHHMIDIADPKDSFSAGLYSKMANEVVEDLLSRGKTPIVCGGSGLYIHSLLYNLDFSGGGPGQTLRECLNSEAEEKGAAYMHEKLAEKDPEAASRIHPNNVKRVVRALERGYGDTESGGIRDFEATYTGQRRYKSRIIRLTADREALYRQIEKRVDVFFQNGLAAEVRGLLDRGVPKNSTAMQGIGYKEVVSMLEGEYDEPEAIRLVKQNTRRYAKRQETWFKRYGDAEILHVEL